jgi:hypothetical protein
VASTVDIDAHGRLVATDEARRSLGDRAGRFALLPSAPDLLVLARTPAAGGFAPVPRCVLAGDLSAFPIADFLAFVHQARLSGSLTVAAAGVERSIAFQRGEVRGARSAATGERIGDVALRLGYVTREQLDALEPGDRRFGQALVLEGHLSPSDLWKCFHEQVAVVFHAILLAREGVFHLLDEGDVQQPGGPLSVDTQSLLMEGIRRIDEMALFQGRIPGPTAFLRRREPPRPVTLQPPELELLALVDGRRRVADVAAAARLSDFEATKVLYHLAEAGYVEAVAAAAPVPAAPAVGPQQLGALASAANAALRDVLAAAQRSGAADELLAALRAFLADPSSRFAPLFHRVPLGADAAVEADVLLGNLAAIPAGSLRRLSPGGDAARFVREGLRELVFFALFQAGERLSRADDEALAAAVKARLGGGGLW